MQLVPLGDSDGTPAAGTASTIGSFPHSNFKGFLLGHGNRMVTYCEYNIKEIQFFKKEFLASMRRVFFLLCIRAVPDGGHITNPNFNWNRDTYLWDPVQKVSIQLFGTCVIKS